MNIENFFENSSQQILTKPADETLYNMFINNKKNNKYFKSDYEEVIKDMIKDEKKYLDYVKKYGKINLVDLKKRNDVLKEKNPNIKYIYNEKNEQLTRTNLNNKAETNILKGLIKNWGIKRNINNVMENIKINKEYSIKKIFSSENTEKIKNKKVNLYIEATYIIIYDENQAYLRTAYYNYTDNMDEEQEENKPEIIRTDGKIKKLYEYIYAKAYQFFNAFPFFNANIPINIYDEEEYIEYKKNETELDQMPGRAYSVVKIKDLETNTKFFISSSDQRLRQRNFYNICNIYNEIVEMTPTNENCVKEYLKKYTEISKKKINDLGNENGVSANEIYNICKDYNIKCILYDIHGKIINANYPNKKSKNKNIIGICYNNHFYGLKNEILKKTTIQTNETIIKTEEEINKIFDDTIIKNLIIPTNIHLNKKLKIGSFINDKKIYFSNNEYHECLNILSIFGLKDKMNPYINLTNISDTIEKIYIKDNINSFFPISICKSAYIYFNNDIKHEEKIKDYITIDKNKFYSWLLKELEYLITLDYRQSNIKTYSKNNQPKNIKDEYLYIASPKVSSILLLNTNIYTGKHLNYAKNKNFEFEILEEIETTTKENYYKNMIIDIYNKIDHKQAKNIINMMVGRMQKDPQIKEKYKITKIANEDEKAGDIETNYIKYNKDIYFKYEKEKQFKNLYNKKPIAIQIKDASAVALYEKIESLKLNDDELISIETDSITFINNGQYEKIKNELDEKDINKWKLIKKDLNYFIKHLGYENSTIDHMTSFKNVCFYNPENQNILFDCYAGAGKSHKIKNEIVPKLDNNYIIITPQHSINKDYKNLGLKSCVMQTFKFTDKIPFEKYIIVDEIGLFDRSANDFLYKCMMDNKIIYSLGDFRQLLPIFEKSHFNKEYYLNFMYKNIYRLKTNYRNNFSSIYYDKLINNQINLINEVKKYSSNDYKKSNVIICITNEEVNKYNNLMMKHLNKKFDDIGAKIICYTNNLKHKNIYNNDDFIILEYDEQAKNYKIDDELYITKEELNKNFKPNYAITLYKAQGQEFENFYFPESSYKFLDGRNTYTLISRLKEKLTEETKENNKKIISKITIIY